MLTPSYHVNKSGGIGSVWEKEEMSVLSPTKCNILAVLKYV